MFENKVLMITGGTGSFGNAVLRRFLHTEIGEVRIFSRDEKKQEDMRTELKNKKVRFFLGDVRDYANIRDAMKGVDYVFHAAALKQVPSCEFYPVEALRTNVIGTENVLQAAIEAGVNRVVFLSTDKAVYPINAMGLSKAMAEKVVMAKSRDAGDTIFCITRYGNVMGSRGSVIPLFMHQIKSGLPITVTDPKMTRFLMSLEDSVELVVHAYQYSKPGDIFVQKAPAATMADLAVALKELFGANNPVKVIGTRHGEKLFETLIAREEIIRASQSERYFQIPADNRDLNYDKFFVEGEVELSRAEDYTSHNTERLTVAGLKERLASLDFVRAELSR
ncbi:polysaccharide biosynthesis protein [Bradyrhizobium iriomotense]|uniref:UDP-glucose 4-epimerase n=1 Tax=Bradyrhizobium iriomotense TaxID=441950 RepID=A0ABQ6B4Y7_9BRAD|nr:polysaccharide biosynthesis protein [Bradyrhizobium iriomotense]GLR87681.1 UDP-glucose 4-epimerase [Bradyrhizobium iriomotense]